MAGLWYGVWLGSDLVTGLFGWLGLVWLTGSFTKCEVLGVWLGDVLGIDKNKLKVIHSYYTRICNYHTLQVSIDVGY